MNSKINTSLGIGVVAVVLALGFISGNQRALAANLCGSGFCEPDYGISYPSPLSHFFGGDVLYRGGYYGYHHFHGYYGFHHFGFHHFGFHHFH